MVSCHSFIHLFVALTVRINAFQSLEYTEKSITYHLKEDSPNMSDIAISWGNIGMAYLKMKQFDKALELTEKCIKVRIET